MNIFWIVVDCVRNYRTGMDDRDKLDFMYELEKKYLSFDKMIVSAPSSIMSISTSLSSIPSYYVAGSYLDYKFDNNQFWCLRDILKQNGYQNHAILNARASREKLTDLLDLVDRKYWEPHLKHSTVCWKNNEVTKVFYNLLDSKPLDPSFYLLWYNARRDPNISMEVKNLYEKLKNEDYLENSIFILTSDHGYPDPDRGLISDGWDLKKVGLAHDILLTDDNINVPFIMNYPGADSSTIKCQTSCEDILPTILEILDIKLPPSKTIDYFGKSLLPLMKNSNDDFFHKRIIRSDARFSMQAERMTSLRTNEYKYIIQHDNKSEELYDLLNDPREKKNMISSKNHIDVANKFRNSFNEMENESINFQKTHLIKKLKEDINFVKLISDDCYVINFGDSYLYEIVLESMLEISPGIKISFITANKNHINLELKPTLFEIFDFNEIKSIQKFANKKIRIEIVDDPLSKIFHNEFFKCNVLRTKNSYRINSVPKIINTTNRLFFSPQIAYYKRVLNRLLEKKDLYLKEPTYLFIELNRLIKVFFGKETN